MPKPLTVAITSCFLVLGICMASPAQQGAAQTSVAMTDERSSREQDGLEGPVRRVRVETAKILMKAGNVVEGPRVVRGIATYDALGRKIDAVDYPVESNTLPGKERYRYDDKGNIVEMVVLGSDDSILSKESYDYEFDQMGNWTKMNTSVAVYENGKVIFEPIETTYRTISYYYNQAIEKISAAAGKAKGTTPSAPANVSGSMSHVRSTPKPVATNTPVPEPVTAELKSSPPKASEPVAPPPPTAGNDTKGGDAATKAKEVIAPADNGRKPAVVKIAENVLRGAAMELPHPEYPQGAMLARATGKVEVELLVDEKGRVVNARATSGNPLLTQAAETAALKARFSPNKLSSDSSMVFGVITYDFMPPEVPRAELVSNPTPESKSSKVDERKPPTKQPDEKTAFAEPKPALFREPKPKTEAESESSHYSKGVAFLAANRYEEAVAALNEAVRVDPNDAKAYLKLAMSYSGMHKEKEAVAAFKLAAQIKPSAVDAPAYYMWGGSYLALDKTSDAISAFKQALYIIRAEAIGLEPKTIQSFPSLEQVHNGLAIAYLNARRFGDSIKELKQVITLNPANAEAHYALGVAYVASGDRRAAENQIKILTPLSAELAQKISAALGAPASRYGCRNITCR
ncbi:MAG: TonB family protein [Pyrinomonadaceae bacterium]